MDFDVITGPVPIAYAYPVASEAVHAELRPGFDPALRILTVELRVDGEIRGVHGWTDNFRHADEPLESIDAFLADHGVRAVTDEEAVLLYAGLVRAKVGVDWQLMQIQIAAQGQA